MTKVHLLTTLFIFSFFYFKKSKVQPKFLAYNKLHRLLFTFNAPKAFAPILRNKLYHNYIFKIVTIKVNKTWNLQQASNIAYNHMGFPYIKCNNSLNYSYNIYKVLLDYIILYKCCN